MLCKNTTRCSKQLYHPKQSILTARELNLDLFEDCLCSPDGLVNVFFCMGNACEACLILTGCHVDALLQLHEGYPQQFFRLVFCQPSIRPSHHARRDAA